MPATSPIVLNNSEFKFFTVETTPVAVDLSCYAIALELTPDTEMIDIGTFCDPAATEIGRTTYSAVATLLWAPGLYDALSPHVGKELSIVFIPDASVTPQKHVAFPSRYQSLPWGRFEVGQRVEVELPLAVLATPAWILTSPT